MNKVDYTLSFIDMIEKNELTESEICDFLESNLFDIEILESYLNYLSEQEEIFNMYLNGEIDDMTISNLIENEYFNDNYTNMLIEASLSSMVKKTADNAYNASKKLPIIGKSVRLIDVDKKRPELRKKIIGNPNFQQSKLKKVDNLAGNAIGSVPKLAKGIANNTPKVAKHLWKNSRRYMFAGLLATGLHGYKLHDGESALRDYKNNTEVYNNLIKRKNESSWFKKSPSDDEIASAKNKMLDSEKEARGKWYYNMVKGKLNGSGDTIDSITKSRLN